MQLQDEGCEDSEQEMAIVAAPQRDPSNTTAEAPATSTEPASTDIASQVEQLFKKASKSRPPGVLKCPIGNALKDYQLVALHDATVAGSGPRNPSSGSSDDDFRTALAKLKET